MSSSERKATASVGRHPSVVPNLSSDDSQNPPGAIAAANKEVPVAGREETIASGTERQQDRKKKQDLFQELEEPIQKVLQENRERFLRIMASSFLAMEVKVKDILKTQCEQRQKLYQDYSLQVTNLSKKLTTDANQVKKHAEKLCFLTQKQMKILQTAIADHETKLENAKDMCDTFLKKAKDLSQHRKTFIGSQQTKVEKEIAKVQDRVIVETQEQDVSVVQTYLQSLFHDCSEETI